MGGMSEAIIRTLRRDDYPALIDLIRRTWYAGFGERTGLLAAEADWENCLARVTTAFVAELDGQPVALIVGRVDALDHRGKLNTHRINSLRTMLRLLFVKDGFKAIGEILGVLGIDRQLRRQASLDGHEYAAEVVLFVLDPAARGHGLGRRMFERMMAAFHEAGVTKYFLFTDSTCDVGFYLHRGLVQVCEQLLPATSTQTTADSFYLYEGIVPEPQD